MQVDLDFLVSRVTSSCRKIWRLGGSSNVPVMHFILLSYFRIGIQPKIKYNFEIRKCENIV